MTGAADLLPCTVDRKVSYKRSNSARHCSRPQRYVTLCGGGVCRPHYRPQSVRQRDGFAARTVDRKGVPPYKRRFLLSLSKATRLDLFSVNKTGREVCMNAQRHEKSLSIMTGVGDEATMLFLLLSWIRDSRTTGGLLALHSFRYCLFYI